MAVVLDYCCDCQTCGLGCGDWAGFGARGVPHAGVMDCKLSGAYIGLKLFGRFVITLYARIDYLCASLQIFLQK